MKMLEELLRGVPTLSVEGSLLREVSGIACDSRRVVPKGLYVALPDDEEAHDAGVLEAIERGAGVVLSEQPLACGARATAIRVVNVRESLSRISARFHGDPSRSLRVIGVTGGWTRSTVAIFLRQILEQAGHRVALVGGIRCEIGTRIFPGLPADAESLDYDAMLGSALRLGCDTAVVELPPEFLMEGGSEAVKIGLMVVARGEPLDDGIISALGQHFEHRWQTHETPVVLHTDDALGAGLLGLERFGVATTYGLGRAAQCRATHLELLRDSTKFVFEANGARQSILSPSVGRCLVMDAMAAMAAGVACGVTLPVLMKAASRFSAPGVLQPVRRAAGRSVFVDGARTPRQFQESLQSLRELCAGQLLVVTGASADLPGDDASLMGEMAARYANRTFVTSNDPCEISPHLLARSVVRGYARHRNEGATVLLDRRVAIQSAVECAGLGDIVLIAGKGIRTYQEIDHTVIPFDDFQVVRDTLEELPPLNAQPETIKSVPVAKVPAFAPLVLVNN